MAIIHYGKFFDYLSFFYKYSGYSILVSMILCSLVYPLYVVLHTYFWVGSKGQFVGRRLIEPLMGKLGVVYEQAGKARVIGITNY